MKHHPVTGEEVPDETASVPVLTYKKARKAQWPKADYVVGNPPYIGNKRMRLALGDGYAEALRSAWTEVSDAVDFVMYWWKNAGDMVRNGTVRRFGFITTNSITQTFNRRVVQEALDNGVSMAVVIPDHPWVDEHDGANVRVAMTVAGPSDIKCTYYVVRDETEGDDGTAFVTLAQVERDHLNAFAKTDNDSESIALRANRGLAFRGITLVGEGFVLTPEEAARIRLPTPRNVTTCP